MFAVITKSSVCDHERAQRTVWLHRGEVPGKLSRVSGSKGGNEGKIDGKQFTIFPNFTNALSPLRGMFPLTTVIPETDKGAGADKPFLELSLFQSKNVFLVPFQFKYLHTEEKKKYYVFVKWSHLEPCLLMPVFILILTINFRRNGIQFPFFKKMREDSVKNMPHH